VREIQHPMYRLALGFLGNLQDVEDACQEILIRIIARLGTFEEEFLRPVAGEEGSSVQ
jgi:DNA-directed RNA polymerase specialized sigma24 family protein